MRILIADESPIFRDGLAQLLNACAGLRVVGSSGGSPETEALLRDLEPDILLVGLAHSRGMALDVLRKAASGQPMRAILLAASMDAPEVAAALQLGACGVVPKDSPADVLIQSIKSVMGGDSWIGDRPVSNMAVGLRKLNTARRRSKAFGLTRRELEILRAVVNGNTNHRISQQFSISESTVKRHVAHIFDKLGASNRIEAALFAAHHRLLDGI